jgi:hypothetical protein
LDKGVPLSNVSGSISAASYPVKREALQPLCGENEYQNGPFLGGSLLGVVFDWFINGLKGHNRCPLQSFNTEPGTMNL